MSVRCFYIHFKVGDNLICPYIFKSETSIQKWVQGCDYDGQTPENGTTVTKTAYEPMKCQKANCAVYYDGRCHYKNYK